MTKVSNFFSLKWIIYTNIKNSITNGIFCLPSRGLRKGGVISFEACIQTKNKKIEVVSQPKTGTDGNLGQIFKAVKTVIWVSNVVQNIPDIPGIDKKGTVHFTDQWKTIF